MTLSIALQNLFHDRVRFAVTLIGVAFSVVLITIQTGLLIGFAQTASALIDRNDADIWIVGKGTSNVDQAAAIPERRLYQALAVPGVEDARRFITHYAVWRKPDGEGQPVVVVGFEPSSGLGGPWNVVAGSVAELNAPDAVLIDELYREDLGVRRLGQVVEINGHRARVVGFTKGIRSFTLSPYVFATLRTAQTFAGLPSDETKFVVLKAANRTDLDELRARVAVRVPEADVYSKAEFSRKTQVYWLLTTGAGLALFAAAVLGFAVGVVIVAQTLYAITMDHLAEFATLRAIGASRGYINKVITQQALVSALFGYAIGIALCSVIVWRAAEFGPALLLPWQLALAVAVLTAVMCMSGGLISMRKVLRLDPATVFK